MATRLLPTLMSAWILGTLAAGAEWAAGANQPAGAEMATGADSAIDAARKDLALRLRVPLERITVVSETVRAPKDARSGCVRVGVPVEEVISKASQGIELVLVVAGQKHYYHALPGQSYGYCELPSTKKRGPIGPPVK